MPKLNYTVFRSPCSTAFLLGLCACAGLLEWIQQTAKPDSITCVSSVVIFLALRLGAVWQALLVALVSGLVDFLTLQPMLGPVLLLSEILVVTLLQRFRNAWSLRSIDAAVWCAAVLPLFLTTRLGDDELHVVKALAGAAEFLFLNQISVAASAVGAAAVPISFIRRRITRRPWIATHEYLASWIIVTCLLPACGALAYARGEIGTAYELMIDHERQAHAMSASLLLGQVQASLMKRLEVHGLAFERPGADTVWVERPIAPFSRVSIGPVSAAPGPAAGAWVEQRLAGSSDYQIRGDVPLDAIRAMLLARSNPLPLHILRRGRPEACGGPSNGEACRADALENNLTSAIPPLTSQLHVWVEPLPADHQPTSLAQVDRAMVLLLLPWLASMLPGYFASRRVTGPMSRAFSALSRATGAPTIPFDNPSLLMLAPRVIARHVARVSWMLRRERARVSELVKEQDALLNASPIVLVLFDLQPSNDWRLRHVSDSMTRIFGWSMDEMREPTWWKTNVNSAGLRGAAAVLDRVRQGERAQSEFRLKTKDEASRFVYTELSLLDTFSDGTCRVIIVWVDITDYKRASKQAKDSNRLASLGTLAAGVAHELKQPLNVISMAAGNALRSLMKGRADGQEAYLVTKLERILEQVNFASRTIEDLRRTAPIKNSEGVLVDVNTVIRQVVNVARGELNLADIELLVDLREPMATVRGLPHQLQQVITNLVINGRDAILADRPAREAPKVDKVMITVRRTRPGRLEVSVEDTGTGLGPEARARMFEPFYSSKDESRSMGLGLFIVRNLVRSLGGDVAAHDGELGARFVVDLPAASPRNSRVVV